MPDHKGELLFMLFVESRFAEHEVEKSLRLPMLDALQAKNFTPLIRASRLRCFEQLLTGDGSAEELERAVAERSDKEGDVPYVRGDLFCFDDHAYFLIFGEEGGAKEALRAGIIHTAETADPAQKLDLFCRNLSEALSHAAREGKSYADDAIADTSPRITWRTRDDGGRVTSEEAYSSSGSYSSRPAQAGVTFAERARVVELLKDVATRSFLRQLSEAHADGRLGEMFSAGARDAAQDEQVARLAGAGLVRREVQVSCRKDGRSLFRLPSTEALAIVTASNAVCSECGAAVADERAEELITPTPLATALLKEGEWLANSMRSVLAEIGLPEHEVKTRASEEGGEAQLLASVCGESFLFVMSDGDFSGAQARRALDAEAETHASRLVIVATGRVHDEARARLREHARRRTRGGSETEVIFVEGIESATGKLRRAVERVSEAALARELFELDTVAGFNVGHMLAVRFRMTQQKTGALEDLAASAAGALAGSLSEL